MIISITGRKLKKGRERRKEEGGEKKGEKRIEKRREEEKERGEGKFQLYRCVKLCREQTVQG